MVRMAERTLSDMQGRPLSVSRFLLFFFFFLIFHPSGCQAMCLLASGRSAGPARAGVIERPTTEHDSGRNLHGTLESGLGGGAQERLATTGESEAKRGDDTSIRATLSLDFPPTPAQPWSSPPPNGQGAV